jgi:hypothetical protein
MMQARAHTVSHCCLLLLAKDDSTFPAAEQQYGITSTEPLHTTAIRCRKAVLALSSCRPFCNVVIPDNDAPASHVGALLRIPCAVGG